MELAREDRARDDAGHHPDLKEHELEVGHVRHAGSGVDAEAPALQRRLEGRSRKPEERGAEENPPEPGVARPGTGSSRRTPRRCGGTGARVEGVAIIAALHAKAAP